MNLWTSTVERMLSLVSYETRDIVYCVRLYPSYHMVVMLVTLCHVFILPALHVQQTSTQHFARDATRLRRPAVIE
jgi:hypothetical protein